MKEVMQITCGWGSTCIRKVALEEFGVTKGGVKLKRHGGGMRRCKMLLRRRKSALDGYTWIGVRII
jgi:cyclopropane fatty-acyl-phospholipid synthase-like methyltransferase